MEISQTYTDKAAELVNLLFNLPQYDLASSYSSEVTRGLKKFDNCVTDIKKIFILSFSNNKQMLESIASIDQTWRQLLAETIFEQDSDKYQKLIEEPNYLFNLYISHKPFPDDGLGRLLDFFENNFKQEIYALKLPLKEMLKDSEFRLKEIFEEIKDQMFELGGHQFYHVEMIAYLHEYFRKETLLYLDSLERKNEDIEMYFIKDCREEIIRLDESQKKIVFI